MYVTEFHIILLKAPSEIQPHISKVSIKVSSVAVLYNTCQTKLLQSYVCNRISHKTKTLDHTFLASK